MNISVFDSQVEASQVWQELAPAYGFRANLFHNPEHLPGMACDAQIVVIDQSIVPHALLVTVATLCQQNPTAQIIATGAALRVEDTVEIMRAGAAWVFSKPLSRPRIASALPLLVQRVTQIAALNQEYQQLDELFSTLTSREKDVLNFLLVGTPNKETAQQLSVSVRTIESRRAKLYRKLCANNVAELVRKIDRRESLGKQLSGQPAIQAVPEPSQPKNNSSHAPLATAPHLSARGLLKPQAC